jgi:hypothetical protein
MKKASRLVALFLAVAVPTQAVELKPAWVPTKTPEAAAKADVAADNYHIYTNGPFTTGEPACVPVGIDDPADRKLVKALPQSHVYCDDVSWPPGLSAEWAAKYNQQVILQLKARK